jgi:hypothetical protein
VSIATQQLVEACIWATNVCTAVRELLGSVFLVGPQLARIHSELLLPQAKHTLSRGGIKGE